MSLPAEPLLPIGADTEYLVRLNMSLQKHLRDICGKINLLSAGYFGGLDNTYAALPTTGRWAKGDKVIKQNPVEAGIATAKYVIIGWVRVTDGTGNVLNTDWYEMRVLTGN